jgi:hypothetical protein
MKTDNIVKSTIYEDIYTETGLDLAEKLAIKHKSHIALSFNIYDDIISSLLGPKFTFEIENFILQKIQNI